MGAVCAHAELGIGWEMTFSPTRFEAILYSLEGVAKLICRVGTAHQCAAIDCDYNGGRCPPYNKPGFTTPFKGR